jgi:hypothetical protein
MDVIEKIKTMPREDRLSKRVRIEIPAVITDRVFEALSRANFGVLDFEREFLLDALKNAKIIDFSPKKRIAVEKATAARSERARKKIDDAINLLRLEGKPLTHYSISKASGVAFQTVKKYIPDLKALTL